MSTMVAFLVLITVAFSFSCLAAYLLVKPGMLEILDYPNARSLHSNPVPRTGGLAIWAGAIVGVAGLSLTSTVPPALACIVAAVLLVLVISFIDDRFDVPAVVRLIAHVAAAGLLLTGGLGLQFISLPGLQLQLPMFVALPLSICFIVWMTNLYNFMDGMDGFAGGMAVFGFGTLGLLAYIAGDGSFALLCWVVAAAAGGFLVLNFPPARIFMGDTGASALGLVAAAFALWGDKQGLFPLWAAVLVFSPFVVDATVTLLRRAVRRARVWEAHRSHYYQRLVQLGWGHRKTVLVEYGLMALCSISAVLCVRLSASAQWTVIVVWAVIYACLIVAVDGLDRRVSYKRALLRQERGNENS
jgi:UDP-N-acetylmuramyl pentapeptide phosphotransferase/UDP-N-acetylglucosamine-1-phosphate transferase